MKASAHIGTGDLPALLPFAVKPAGQKNPPRSIKSTHIIRLYRDVRHVEF